MMHRSDPAQRPVQPSPTAARRHPEPDAYFVRAHRRGGFCVMIEGRAMPISKHWSSTDAVKLAESLAKKSNARVVVET